MGNTHAENVPSLDLAFTCNIIMAARKATQKVLVFGTVVGGALAAYIYMRRKPKFIFETVGPSDPKKKVETLMAVGGLDPNSFRSITLTNIRNVNHNTKFFTFSFDDPKSLLNMKIASCTMLKTNIDGKDVVRPYTPTTRPNTQGYLEFLIKYYPQGIMSKYIHNMKKGDKIEIKGPIPKYDYHANKFQNLALIAGGTGLTPMIQMIEEVLFNSSDKTKITFLYANSSFDDILLKDDLDKLAQKYPDQFKCYYTTDKFANKDQKKSWKGETGHITANMLKKLLPMPSKPDDESLLVMVCGPPGFMKLISGEKTPDYKQGELSGLLKQLGFTEKNVFKF
ncbi:unnamed protein product [Didymodactylos carnosus]|uniref:NADH-cytochrome b5 reductase n=1 Tax=Didymodactylos carnosus TaxID=1234261 RepID=A0A814ESG7_9BILA|nr:unnamed protein product [Didymodactylos carnosus]CAF1058100.1 unnamed protein product [Didymodactylos carnosus]CAF3746258.1 unnamed protein product [Didymodactylos carnosus]CAF3824020.1 unnamed protein product [Didymodactylos carnosus]